MFSKLPIECLLEILKSLNTHNDLYQCIFVNRAWCSAAIPLIWSDPWQHVYEYYDHEEELEEDLPEMLLSTFISCLSEEDRNFLIESGVILMDWMKKGTCFDYPTFLRHLNLNDISYGAKRFISNNFGKYDLNLTNFLIEKIGSLSVKKVKRLDLLGFIDRFNLITTPYVDYSSVMLKFLPEATNAFEYIRKFVFKGDIKSEFLYGLANRCRTIEDLEIHDIFKDDDALAYLIRSQKSLRSFYLEATKKKTFEITSIQNAFIGIDSLICLRMKHKLFPLKFFIKCTGLQKLHLESINDDVQDMEKFVNHGFPELKNLRIRVKNISIKHISLLINNTRGHFDELFIFGKVKDPENAFIFRDSLVKKCVNLYILSLAFLNIENFIPPLPVFFKTFKNLKYLDLMLSISENQRNIGADLVEIAPYIQKKLGYIHFPKNWYCDKESSKKFFNILDRKDLVIMMR
ncbi:16126_t:CDS:1 [Funneliformis geosporum]|uniref:17005_t:CDS:1 n=1 Tax=Funneliformis geosporum TaxID=1117311 RepID=A0A9W4WNB6_9GLOM|nr:17005_t:CDS:1 [Funneliformis geosporum]CAI2193970.1 16126_t:CDS:1 [Funneliformis geosporum]